MMQGDWAIHCYVNNLDPVTGLPKKPPVPYNFSARVDTWFDPRTGKERVTKTQKDTSCSR